MLCTKRNRNNNNCKTVFTNGLMKVKRTLSHCTSIMFPGIISSNNFTVTYLNALFAQNNENQELSSDFDQNPKLI